MRSHKCMHYYGIAICQSFHCIGVPSYHPALCVSKFVACDMFRWLYWHFRTSPFYHSKLPCPLVYVVPHWPRCLGENGRILTSRSFFRIRPLAGIVPALRRTFFSHPRSSHCETLACVFPVALVLVGNLHSLLVPCERLFFLLNAICCCLTRAKFSIDIFVFSVRGIFMSI